MVELGLVPRKTVSKPGSHPRPPAFKSFGRTSLKYEGFQVSWQPIYGYLGVGGRIHSSRGLGREETEFHRQGLEHPEPSLSMPVLKMGAGAGREGAEALSSPFRAPHPLPAQSLLERGCQPG